MFEARLFYLIDDYVRQQIINVVKNCPVNVEVIIRERTKKRTKQQNAFMWSSMVGDFEKQGWWEGRQLNSNAWHKMLKWGFLPEHAEEGITKPGYVKWGLSLTGEKILLGSTKDLTTKGFSEYLERCYSFGAQELGIQFHELQK